MVLYTALLFTMLLFTMPLLTMLLLLFPCCYVIVHRAIVHFLVVCLPCCCKITTRLPLFLGNCRHVTAFPAALGDTKCPLRYPQVSPMLPRQECAFQANRTLSEA